MPQVDEPPPTAAEALAAPLSRFAGCWLELRCDRCRGRSTTPAVKMMLREHGDRPLIDLARRFRCQGCRQTPTAVYLNQTHNREHNHGTPPGWSVRLDQVLRPGDTG